MIITCTTNVGRLAFLKGELMPMTVYNVALYSKSADLGKKTAAYGVPGEVTGQRYAAKRLPKPTYGIDEATDLAYMKFEGDVVWPGSTISADGCMVYTASGLAVYIGAFGSTIASTNDAFTITLPTINFK